MYEFLGDHKSCNKWNIFCVEDNKRKATKSISRRYGYHRIYSWNMWRSASKRLCSLREMDQRVNDCLAAWHEQQYKNFIAG